MFTGSCYTSPENDSPDATALSSKSDSGVYINVTIVCTCACAWKLVYIHSYNTIVSTSDPDLYNEDDRQR